MRWEEWTSLSKIASAMVASPIRSYHFLTGICETIMVLFFWCLSCTMLRSASLITVSSACNPKSSKINKSSVSSFFNSLRFHLYWVGWLLFVLSYRGRCWRRLFLNQRRRLVLIWLWVLFAWYIDRYFGLYKSLKYLHSTYGRSERLS